MQETYGYPYWLIHRGDFHRILYERAKELGVTVITGSPVKSVDETVPSVTTADGTTFTADVIIGADGTPAPSPVPHKMRFGRGADDIGIKSQVRKAVITDREVKITPDPNCAYRTLVPAQSMLSDPELASLIKSPAATCWIGHEGHVMAYPIRQGTLYNFVMCHPGSVAVGKQNEPASLDDMKTKYATWDPVLTRIIERVPQCLKWQNAEIEKIETWCSKSGRVVLMGDAAHAMVPYMAQVLSPSFLFQFASLMLTLR
jgi:salicylate hydroxylase